MRNKIGYDIDGVITEGIVPLADSVIVTGRSFEEAPETYYMLHSKGIFNAVYFNPVPFIEKTIENSGEWKGKICKLLSITWFYEDDVRQAEIIKSMNKEIQILLIKESK